MTVAAVVAIASLAPLWKRKLRRVPLPTWGMVIAHFGVAVALAGMAAESAFIKERLVAAAPGETVKVADFSVKFTGVEPIAGPNYTAIKATLVATTPSGGRSGEHTSELQSLMRISYAVFCLKKQNIPDTHALN